MIGETVILKCAMQLVGGESLTTEDVFVVERLFQTSDGERLALSGHVYVPCIKPSDVLRLPVKVICFGEGSGWDDAYDCEAEQTFSTVMDALVSGWSDIELAPIDDPESQHWTHIGRCLRCEDDELIDDRQAE
jgi:hypothetical protein